MRRKLVLSIKSVAEDDDDVDVIVVVVVDVDGIVVEANISSQLNSTFGDLGVVFSLSSVSMHGRSTSRQRSVGSLVNKLDAVGEECCTVTTGCCDFNIFSSRASRCKRFIVLLIKTDRRNDDSGSSIFFNLEIEIFNTFRRSSFKRYLAEIIVGLDFVTFGDVVKQLLLLLLKTSSGSPFVSRRIVIVLLLDVDDIDEVVVAERVVD